MLSSERRRNCALTSGGGPERDAGFREAGSSPPVSEGGLGGSWPAREAFISPQCGIGRQASARRYEGRRPISSLSKAIELWWPRWSLKPLNQDNVTASTETIPADALVLPESHGQHAAQRCYRPVRPEPRSTTPLTPGRRYNNRPHPDESDPE